MSETEYALGVHCGITFAGIKPASLFWLKDEHCPDISYFRRLFAEKGFRFIAVKRSEGRKLFYVFHDGKLKKILSDPDNRAFLSSRGYEYENVGEALRELKTRMESGEVFPHEIGLFLGYPLEDVRGFIDDARGGTCLDCGYWKVYGQTQEKARLFERYRRCSRCICEKIEGGKPLEEIFRLN